VIIDERDERRAGSSRMGDAACRCGSRSGLRTSESAVMVARRDTREKQSLDSLAIVCAASMRSRTCSSAALVRDE
jgi:hypothetical protein